MSKHLVLGGGGFIGSHLARRLVDQGHQVKIVDVQFESWRQPNYEGSLVEAADLRYNEQAIDSIGWQPDVIWQLAADMGGVEYFHSDKDWQAAVNNQIINVNVMDAVARWAPNARVIFTSTACALAIEKQTHFWQKNDQQIPVEHRNWPLTERDILWGTPDQLYGQEKRNSALLWKAAPIDTRVCFLHTVYGPYQEHSGIRMKFPSAVAQKARKARETGTIELLGDGRQVRSYLYIKDAIDRLMVLGNSDTDPGFVNIGGTKPYTVDEVADIAITAAYGCRPCNNDHLLVNDIELVHIDGPTGVEARCADMTKFNTAFPEFHPTFAKTLVRNVSLTDGMRKMIDWLDTL